MVQEKRATLRKALARLGVPTLKCHVCERLLMRGGFHVCVQWVPAANLEPFLDPDVDIDACSVECAQAAVEKARSDLAGSNKYPGHEPVVFFV